MADKASSQLVDETLFPVKLRQAVNYLWRLCRPLREVRGIEPIRVTVSEANMVVELNEAGQAALTALIAAQANGQTLSALPGVEIYIASSNTVVTATILIAS
jgi:hypothetical protein